MSDRRKSESKKNNANPKRRRLARAKIGVTPGAMARWSLLTVIADGMAPTGEYSPDTLCGNRTAVRAFEKFIGFEQSPVTVTEAKFESFREWLMDQGYERSTVDGYWNALSTVVRFADIALLPSRQSAAKRIFADAAVAGSIEFLLVNEFFPVAPRLAKDSTKRHYGYSIRRLSHFLGRPATCADLTDDTIEQWLAKMQAEGLNPRTIKGYAINLFAFWKWAAERRLVQTPPTIIGSLAERRPVARKLNPHGEGSISKFAERYLSRREVSAFYAANLRARSAKLAKFAGTQGMDRTFSEKVVNAFLASLKLKPVTVCSYRSNIISLWNAAADDDLVPYPRLRRITRPKCPELVIECYTVAEARQLLGRVELLDGVYENGVARRLYWQAIIMTAWDTGLRRGDLWLLKKSEIRSDGTLRIVQHKTGQVVTVRLRESTIKKLAAIHFDKALHWPHNASFFGRHFKRLVESSGVNRGTFKWVRRASGTYVDLQHVGAGTKHLGHSSPQMFAKHYDGNLGGHTLPMPPDLDESA